MGCVGHTVILVLASAHAFPCTASEVASPPSRTEWITLGTGGGPVIRRDRSEPANALRVGNAIYLFDVGAGTQKRLAEAGLDPSQVRAIFLSHLHIDHTADLGPFLINRWVLSTFSPLTIFGPRGTRSTMAGIAKMAGPLELTPVTLGGPGKPAFGSNLATRELATAMDRPAIVYRDGNVTVQAITNAHYNFPRASTEARYARSYAFRITTGDRTYAYTGDTGLSDNVIEIARGADILFSEVIDLAAIERTLRRAGSVPAEVVPGLLKHMAHDHLTPDQVGQMARRAGVKRVVLTHLVPGEDGEADLATYRRGLEQHFVGPVTIARDLDRF